MENTELREREIHYVYGGCCAPMGRQGVSFWGVALVAIGALALLSNLTLFNLDIGGIVIPGLLLACGIAILLPKRDAVR